jgi:homoserine dehydrogenase
VVRALFLGFGHVGRRLAEILTRRERYPGLAALDLSVVAITTGRHGALANPSGIDLASALRAFDPEHLDHPDRTALASLDAVRGLDYDVLVEMTPLAIRARGEPAITHVREALLRGRHVVTCNKGPVAWAYEPLARLARERGCAFLFESTVMDGAPVFNLARHGLRGDTIERLAGILNSTTNVVLCALEEGLTLDEALARARALGVAEADPSDDLEGWDAAVKVAALGNVLLGGPLLPEEVERESLASVPPERVREAAARGRRIKMDCEAWREGGRLRGRVAARELPLDDPFALVAGTGSILRLTTALLGKLSLVEENPDLTTTAYGVLSDLLSLPGPPR